MSLQKAVSVNGAGESKTSILVVDDDQLVRSYVAEVLRRAGYSVITAGDAAEALAFWNNSSVRISALITDIDMPLVAGPELARGLWANVPQLPVVYISGHDGHELVDKDVAIGNARFLLKPFRPDALVEILNAALSTIGSQ